MRSLLLLFLLTFSLHASAGTVSRVTDFVPGTKAEADEVDAEFDNIISAINGNLDADNLAAGAIATAQIGNSAITSQKILDNTITIDDIATNAGAYVYNRRVGCQLEDTATGDKIFKVLTPCEVVINGVRAALTATQNVSVVTNMDSGSPSVATWHYVYVKSNTGTPTFEVSLTNPDMSTAKKIGDTTSRYLGAIRTGAATTDVLTFRKNRNEFRFEANPLTGIDYTQSISVGTGGTTTIMDVPKTAMKAIFDVISATTTFADPGQCLLTSTQRPSVMAITLFKNPTNYYAIHDHIVDIPDLYTFFSRNSTNNCDSVTLYNKGYIEPDWLYQ